MVVYCSSDWHCAPGELRPPVRRFLDLAVKDSDLIIGNGDLFDLMQFDWKSFVDCASIRELKQCLQGKKFIYVAGNHDPAKYVKRIIQAPNVEVVARSHEEQLGRTTYHFVHGYHWGRRWSGLQYLSNFLIKVAPPIYNWWLNNVKSAKRAKERGEREKYNRLTGHVHSRACQFAERKGIVVIVGHTHKPWVAGSWQQYLMYDDGDMVDSWTYLRIEDDRVERRTLP